MALFRPLKWRLLNPYEKEFITNHINLFHETLLYSGWVIKTGNSKGEDRLIVITQYHVFIIKSAKSLVSIQKEYHLYDLVDIRVQSDQMYIAFISYSIQIFCVNQENSLLLYQTLFQSYTNITRNFNNKCNFSGKLYDQVVTYETLCDAFPIPILNEIDTYIVIFKACCSYYGLIPEEYVISTLTNILNYRNSELDLNEFELNYKLLKVFAKVASSNNYFTHYYLSDYELSTELVGYWATAFELNPSFKSLSFYNAKMSPDVGAVIALAKSAAFNGLTHLDLGGNRLGDKGLLDLVQGLECLSTQMEYISIEGFHCTEVSLIPFISLLCSNACWSSGLEYLNMSDNTFNKQTSKLLSNWLTSGAALNLESLVLNNCPDLILSVILTYIVSDYGVAKTPNLKHFCGSYSNITDDSGMQLSRHIASTGHISYLDISYNKVNASVAEAIFASLVRNPILSLASVDFSGILLNPIIVVKIASLLINSTNIMSLKLADCKLEVEGMYWICKALTGSPCITELVLDRNICEQNSYKAGDAIVELLKKTPSLTSLSIGGLAPTHKINLLPILEVLETSHTLRKLNISNNSAGNDISYYIKKMLLSNKSLQVLSCDGNDLIHSGFCIILQGIELNKCITTLCEMRIDIATVLAKEPLQRQAIEDCFGRVKLLTNKNRRRLRMLIK